MMTPEQLAEIRDRASFGISYRSLADRRDLLAEVDRLRAQVAAVRDLLPDEDDPYVHVHPEGEGDPDCGGCWNADLLRILA